MKTKSLIVFQNLYSFTTNGTTSEVKKILFQHPQPKILIILLQALFFYNNFILDAAVILKRQQESKRMECSINLHHLQIERNNQKKKNWKMLTYHISDFTLNAQTSQSKLSH